uniref:Uncharacterized protein n=1 Tax=Rhizophora mucronata TaxID=61149 RepID=A0A2P2QVD7_RHIMU
MMPKQKGTKKKGFILLNFTFLNKGDGKSLGFQPQSFCGKA